MDRTVASNLLILHDDVLFSGNCSYGTVPCSSGLGCINQSAICDGKVDCHDFSDEFGCGKETIF